jgi:hypothetical protein
MRALAVWARRRWIEQRFPSYSEPGILRVEHRGLNLTGTKVLVRVQIFKP